MARLKKSLKSEAKNLVKIPSGHLSYEMGQFYLFKKYANFFLILATALALLCSPQTMLI